jgi:hypothetical protein
MTHAQDPAGPDARRDDPPPPQQPPAYLGDAAAELPGDAPAASSQQNETQGSNGAVERPRINKPEGSGYASSYRPSDAQNNPPPVCVHASCMRKTY